MRNWENILQKKNGYLRQFLESQNMREKSVLIGHTHYKLAKFITKRHHMEFVDQ